MIKETALLLIMGLLVSAGTLAAPAEEQKEATGLTVSNPAHSIEFRLPAPYWEAYDRGELSERFEGGCAGRRLPENLLYVASHKDAPCQVLIFTGNQRFLMRNRDDLEAFVDASVEAVTERLGSGGELKNREYGELDGMITHRLAFTAPVRGGPGCPAAGGGGGETSVMRYLFVYYFVRPAGEDAFRFEARCFAPVDPYDELEPEIELLVSSFRYTGETAESFFDADAPAEKVPTAEEARESTGEDGGIPGWLIAAGLIVIIWMLMRRKKKAEPVEPEE